MAIKFVAGEWDNEGDMKLIEQVTLLPLPHRVNLGDVGGLEQVPVLSLVGEPGEVGSTSEDPISGTVCLITRLATVRGGRRRGLRNRDGGVTCGRFRGCPRA